LTLHPRGGRNPRRRSFGGGAAPAPPEGVTKPGQGEPMVAVATAPPSRADEREGVSLARLLWAAPLTIGVALALNYLIKSVAQALAPSLVRMGQLGPPLISLTLQGAVGAVVLFTLLALLVRHPITWFRRIALAVLLLSLLPDIALGLGGQTAMLGMRAMGP